MQNQESKLLERVAIVLVVVMALIQSFYAIYGYVDPVAFSNLRGTELVAVLDSDWITIYASRTLFIALLIGYLAYSKSYRVLMWAALFGVVMPITDGLLAYEAQAATKVIAKHVITAIYLLVTSLVLRRLVLRRLTLSS